MGHWCGTSSSTLATVHETPVSEYLYISACAYYRVHFIFPTCQDFLHPMTLWFAVAPVCILPTRPAEPSWSLFFGYLWLPLPGGDPAMRSCLPTAHEIRSDP